MTDKKEKKDVEMQLPQIYVEKTLAIIKPDAIEKAKEIESIILNSGFYIIQKRKIHLTPELASDLYADHFGKMFFPALIAYMSSSSIIAYVLAKEDAVASWLNLIGPTNPFKGQETHPGCLRATYGTDQTRNAVHGSETREAAEREIRFLFPDSIIEPILSGESAKEYITKKINPTLFKGLAAICRVKPADPVIWLADWLLMNNPNQPQVGKNVTIVTEE